LSSKSLTPAVLQTVSTYPALRNQVEEALLQGRRKIESAKVLTYLRTGKIIDDHISRYEMRGDYYGSQVIQKLADDLDLDSTVLWRCLKFAQSFKNLAGGQQSLPPNLTWSHYRELITVPDKATRLSLMKRAAKAEWSAIQLAQTIQQEVTRGTATGQEPQSLKLLPKRGILYTYRLVAPDSVHKCEDADRLWIDLGFQFLHQLPGSSKGFKAGSLIESVKDKDGEYSILSTKRTESDLYTYKADVERVVDGDTIIVKIDLGFGNRCREYLRFRGIDAPEMNTPEGKKAREFVVGELAKVDHVILTSTKADKYGRYLADIYYGPEDGVHLNQRLLDEGLALYYY
jgi:endonuclease YncB( thermonuclease family)